MRSAKLILIIILLIAQAGFPEIRYVSKTGTSTPPYTSWETASDSIQKCINISGFGDTIYVGNGVYKEKVVMIPGLALIGTGMDSCIVDTREYGETTTINVTDSCYLSGFQVISYDKTHGTGIRTLDFNIEKIYAVIEYNKVSEARDGIDITTSSLAVDDKYKLVGKNIITNVENGIISQQTCPIISENIIYAKRDALVSQILSYPSYLNNLIIYHNVIGIRGISGAGYHTVARNNLIYGRCSYGFYFYGTHVIENNTVFSNDLRSGYGMTGAGFTAQNNHIENCSAGVYHDQPGGSAPFVKYNNFWNNNNNSPNLPLDTTNIYSYPIFVSTDSMDFHLQMYSRLIDAGDPNILDVDGTRSDIGLYGGPYGEITNYKDFPPKPPKGHTVSTDSSKIFLSWRKNAEADFRSYYVYFDSVQGFTADTTRFLAELRDTFYIHTVLTKYERVYYKLRAIDNQGNLSGESDEVGVVLVSNEEKPQIVQEYELYQNYPNPFNPSTIIPFRLKERGYVKLYVYDIKGELVSTLINEEKDAGYHEVKFSIEGLNNPASGIYIYQIMIRTERNIPVFTDMRKMVYIK